MSLPRLYVRNSMNIEHSQIAELQPDTMIVGSLLARGSALAAIPEGLDIGRGPRGDLDIRELTNITTLPESLEVHNGRILAGGSGLTWDGVPAHLKAKVRGLGDPPELSSSRAAPSSSAT